MANRSKPWIHPPDPVSPTTMGYITNQPFSDIQKYPKFKNCRNIRVNHPFSNEPQFDFPICYFHTSHTIHARPVLRSRSFQRSSRQAISTRPSFLHTFFRCPLRLTCFIFLSYSSNFVDGPICTSFATRQQETHSPSAWHVSPSVFLLCFYWRFGSSCFEIFRWPGCISSILSYL